MTRYLYFFLGFTSLVLAVIGIILPGVPGIPFILMSGYFFSLSSEKWMRKLQENRYTGVVFKRIRIKGSNPWFIFFVLSQFIVSMIVLERLLIHDRYYSTLFYLLVLGLCAGLFFLLRKFSK